MKPRALDLFCGAGGATKGLQRAGFHVTGVDIKAQPRYCGDVFHQADALTFPLEGFDFIWASPVCKGYSSLVHYGSNPSRRGMWPLQIPAVRSRLIAAGSLYCIENVSRAPLETAMFLCGQMFGLPLIRHRLLEANFGWLRPHHVCAKRGATLRKEVFIIAGLGAGRSRDNRKMAWLKSEGQRALGIEWMTRAELAEAIPPAYSEFIGRQVMQILECAA